MSNLYLLAILPPKQLSEQIHEIRLECAAKFGVQKALRPPVHISLYRPFRIEDSFENRLIRLMHQTARNLHSFEQILENFDAFNTHVVFIRGLKNPGIINLHRCISSVFKKHQIDPQENKNNTPFQPHITIAYRDILPEIFPAIWQEYKDRKFKRSFMVDRFTLLKHDHIRWNPIEDFMLAGIDQPTLFG